MIKKLAKVKISGLGAHVFNTDYMNYANLNYKSLHYLLLLIFFCKKINLNSLGFSKNYYATDKQTLRNLYVPSFLHMKLI